MPFGELKVQLVLSPAAAGRELTVHGEKGAPGHPYG